MTAGRSALADDNVTAVPSAQAPHAQPPYGPPPHGSPYAQLPYAQRAYGAPPYAPPPAVHSAPYADVGPASQAEGHGLAHAIFSGRGFSSPRVKGIGLAALGVVAAIVNVITLFGFSAYFRWLVIVPGPLLLAGLFLAITDEPRYRGPGVTAPLWSRIGLALSLVGGVGVSVFLLLLMKEFW